MNNLNSEKKGLVIRCLVDGVSVRGTERITGVHRDTILRLMLRVGKGCQILLDQHMQELTCERLEVDEIWSFIQKKQRAVHDQKDPDKNEDFGHSWVFVAIDPDTKIVPCHKVGKRTTQLANEFIEDLKCRMLGRVQLSSDGLRSYVEAVEQAFGGDVDYGQIVKTFETDAEKVSLTPAIHGEAHIGRHPIYGKPDPRYISTSLVERQNLTMRMGMRRFTRKTNGFSKKLENHKAAVALHFGHYNFVRRHQTIRTAPAVCAGVTSETWPLAGLIIEAEHANARHG